MSGLKHARFGKRHRARSIKLQAVGYRKRDFNSMGIP